MSEHKASVRWKRTTPDFNYETYDRTHEVIFEGGQKVKSSAAPTYMGKAEHSNPEEFFVASLSTCHMLTLLAVAAKSRFTVDSYEDHAVAILDKNENGKLAVVKTILRPKVVFSGEKKPTTEQIKDLHSKAHHNCMIANSVRTDVVVEPVL